VSIIPQRLYRRVIDKLGKYEKHIKTGDKEI
jgi:hypothetical protein